MYTRAKNFHVETMKILPFSDRKKNAIFSYAIAGPGFEVEKSFSCSTQHEISTTHKD